MSSERCERNWEKRWFVGYAMRSSSVFTNGTSAIVVRNISLKRGVTPSNID